jgi:hypothetical protein
MGNVGAFLDPKSFSGAVLLAVIVAVIAYINTSDAQTKPPRPSKPFDILKKRQQRLL